MKRLRTPLVIAVVILAVLAGIYGLVKLRSGHAAGGQGGGRYARSRSAPPWPRLADVPLTVDGIGTVQALNTVNIKPMVDGPLTEIRFREGQDVHVGDVLARIDSRTYQAAYDQAVAKKAQDEATLANAQRDLGRYDKLAKTQYTTAQQADTQRSTVAQTTALVRQDQAQVDSARTNLSYTTITAPVDGRTGIRQVDLGNLVHSTRRHADHRGDHAAPDLCRVHPAAADAAAGGGRHRGRARPRRRRGGGAAAGWRRR